MTDIIRKTIGLPESLWTRVSTFRHARRLQSEREAIQLLVEAGLRATAKPKQARKEEWKI
jgi:hypothetical protein